MKVLLTGSRGQLGYDLVTALLSRGYEVIATARTTPDKDLFNSPLLTTSPLDVTNESAVKDTITRLRPNVVINCAAWTAVDKAEDPAFCDAVFLTNGEAPAFIARACQEIGAVLIHISSDYVFSGSGEAPYSPDSKDFSPLNIYGQSKLLGERAVSSILKKFFIVRTSWVFGANGPNFVKTMLRLGATNKDLRVVSDQIGTPTYTVDLANLLSAMCLSDRYGFYHATNSELNSEEAKALSVKAGFISWADFAREIFSLARIPVTVTPVLTRDYKTPARRPLNSRLNKEKLQESGLTPLPNWVDALKRYLKEIKKI